MNCPKCRAPNADEALFCPICHEAFKKKPVTPKFLVIPSVVTHVKGWHFTGILAVGTEALYFLVEKEEYRLSGPERLIGLFAGQVGGFLGGAAADKALGVFSGGQERPGSLAFKSTVELEELKERCLGQAPRLVFCTKYFKIPRVDVRAAWIPEDDRLLLHGLGCSFEVTGEIQEEAVMGHLRAWSYPVKPFGSARTRWAKFLAGLLLLGSGSAVLLDFYELHQAGERIAAIEAVRNWQTAGRSSGPILLLVGAGIGILVFARFYTSYINSGD